MRRQKSYVCCKNTERVGCGTAGFNGDSSNVSSRPACQHEIFPPPANGERVQLIAGGRPARAFCRPLQILLCFQEIVNAPIDAGGSLLPRFQPGAGPGKYGGDCRVPAGRGRAMPDSLQMAKHFLPAPSEAHRAEAWRSPGCGAVNSHPSQKPRSLRAGE